MKFKELASYLDKLENTPKRLEITSILSDLFKKSSDSEIDKITYLSLGTLAPNYESIILNIAEKMMIRVLSMAYDKSIEEISKLYKSKGDLGSVAQELAIKSTGDLSVAEVYEKLVGIAKDSGEGSQERKVTKTSDLLKQLDPLSARFVTRIPVGKLRLGFSEKTVIDSLSDFSGIDKKEIEEAYNIRPDIGYVAKLVKEKKLGAATPKLGIPVVPMLAARLNSTDEMIKKMGEVSVEPKFDGLRIFIHFRKKDNFLRIFTRNMNAIPNETFPELSTLAKYIKADEVILDTEAVGIDVKREMFLDFQKTISRRRKHNVEQSSTEIPLQFQVFDILYVDGENLLKVPYQLRRKQIEKVVVNGDLLRVDESTVTSDPDIIKKLHEKYLKMGLEGVVVKKSNGLYVSGRTGWNWAKMKEVEGARGKIADTLDCVVMGYTQGKGKRSGFGIGQFLAGVKDGEVVKTVTKVGTGLTDELFKELNARLKKLVVKTMPKEYLVDKDLYPDYWVTPEVVVELAADEITVSPKHTSGLALRFPRLVKFRDDKSAKEATTLKELKSLAKMQ